MTTIGEVNDVTRERNFEWRIKDFFSLSEKDGKSYNSSSFKFADYSWYLRIYPNGHSRTNSVGYISVYLCRSTRGSSINLKYSFGLKISDGKIDKKVQDRATFYKKDTGYGAHQLVKRSELLLKNSELAPSDVLTIVCTLEYSKSAEDLGNISTTKCSFCKKSYFAAEHVSSHEENCSYKYKSIMCPRCNDVVELSKWLHHECQMERIKGTLQQNVAYCRKFEDKLKRLWIPFSKRNISTIKCSYCKKSFDGEHVSSHEENCLYKSIMCPRCNNVVEFSKWLHHECQMERIKATEKILDDLENILNSKEYSDVTIKVKDEEFKLHRDILAGRNPYFQSMFTTDMKEKSTGIVSIDDCEPAIFKSFIFFVYTGKMQTLSDDTLCDLFEVSDKYQQNDLKSECLDYMKTKISIDNFFSFMVLALRHNEKKLIETATDFFCRNTKEIILTVKWQAFVEEYSTQANELFIKTFNHNAK